MKVKHGSIIFLEKVLLPGGRQEIDLISKNINECIKQYYKENKKLICSLVSIPQGKTYNYFATECDIVDFSNKENKASIIIESKTPVKISYWSKKSPLSIEYTPIDKIKKQEINESLKCISEELLKVYDENPELSRIYSEINLNDISWVAYRWLELLPISYHDIHNLIKTKNPYKIGKTIKNLLYLDEI